MLKPEYNHIRVPDEILKRRDLKPTEKLVLGMVIRLQGYQVSVCISFERMAQRLGISRSSVKRAVKTLKRLDDLIVMAQYATVGDRRYQTAHLLSSRWANARNVRRAWAERREREA